MDAPTGQQNVIESDGYRAVITETGATLRELTFEGRPLISGFGASEMPSSGSGQLLAPWTNRIRDGRYTFRGTTHQLPLSEPVRHNASHGLVRWLSWHLAEQAADSLTMGVRLAAQTGYPWSLDLTVTYALGPQGLHVTQSATNLSREPAPYASGAHPYLVAPPEENHGYDDCGLWELTQPGATYLRVDGERLLPTGRGPIEELLLDDSPDPIGTLVLDHAVTDLARDDGGRAHLYLRGSQGDGAGVGLWVDEQHRWLQLFTGEGTSRERTALAVEPMTAPPDAFNSGEDLTILEPGERFTATWGIHAVAKGA